MDELTIMQTARDRLEEWCRIDSDFAKFLKETDKVYWMLEEDKVLNLIYSSFASVPIGAKTCCMSIIYDALGLETSDRIGNGNLYVFKDYFIDSEDLFPIWRKIAAYADSIGRIMDVPAAYGYPPGSSPKIGLPYDVQFIMKEAKYGANE